MSYTCYKCHSAIQVATNQQVGFKESCDKCTSDLHACRNCTFYDITAYNSCREPSAERVVDKEKANYCDYFKFTDASHPTEAGLGAARKKLDDLFK